MELLCSSIEVLASFVESVLILSTITAVSGSRFSRRRTFQITFLFAALSTCYLICMNEWSPFSFLTPIGTMLLSIFIEGKILSKGKTVLRSCSCILALFVIQSIDYILIIGMTLLHGNPRDLFYGYLKPGMIRVIYLTLDKICDVILYFCFRKYLQKLSEMQNSSIIKLLLCTVLSYGAMQYLFAMVLHGDFIQLQGAAMVSLFVLLCFLLILAFSMLTVSFSEKEKATNLMLTNLNQMMETNYYILNESITATAKAMHDFHHHLSVIDTLAQKEECTSITEYIHSVLTTSFTPAQLCRSGNSIIDAVINSKLNEAQYKGINISYTIHVEDLSAFEQADICAILSNQIENALEACEKMEDKRNVQIDIRQQEGFVLFKVINNVSKDPFMGNGNLSSTKADSAVMHGLGLKNIQDIARKYNGSLKSEYVEGHFVSTVLISAYTI